MAKKKTTTRTSRSTSRKRPSSRSKKKSKNRKLPSPSIDVNNQQKVLVVGIGIIFLTAVLILSLISPSQGQLTSSLAGLLGRLFGWGSILVPITTGLIGLYLVLWGMEQEPELPGYRVGGIITLFFVLMAFATLTVLLLENEMDDVWEIAKAEMGGGYIGGAIVWFLTRFVGILGTVFILMILGLVAIFLASGVSRKEMGDYVSALWDSRKEKAEEKSAAKKEKPKKRAIPINPAREDSGQLPLLDEKEKKEPVPIDKPKRPRRSLRKKKADPVKEEDDQPTAPQPPFLGNVQAGAVNWTLPKLEDMLESGTDQDVHSATIREQVEIIEHTLESFGAPATVVEINQGPTITQFGVEPLFIQQRSGKRTKVKVGKIAGLADDLTLALAAQSIRIQAPVPGKGYIGIEVPNPDKALVSLRDVMETKEFTKSKSPLAIGLGQNVAGQPIVSKLDGMPHVLIAGTTGSGKSVCVNGIIACLLMQNTPEELKLVMVDPKRVELTGYNGIPHLAAPVVVEMDRVIGTLQWALREMDTRYKMFAEVGARNLVDFNKKVKKNGRFSKLPYIVIIIDELADLMMLSPEETEKGITRLAQMARATGIHMIIATQRPSVDVVTGLIKANFPARIAFAVASSTDSRVILDSTGAEKLLGQGDMLFQSQDAPSPIRMQGAYVSPDELNRIIDYWKTARRFNLVPTSESVVPREVLAAEEQKEAIKTRKLDETAVDLTPSSSAGKIPQSNVSAPIAAGAGEKPAQTKSVETKPTITPQPPLWEELQKEVAQPQHEDALMDDAIALVRQLNKASTSLLQRRFRIGYTRGARMMDAMEEMGIIGPPTGTSKAREVLPWGADAVVDATNNQQPTEN